MLVRIVAVVLTVVVLWVRGDGSEDAAVVLYLVVVVVAVRRFSLSKASADAIQLHLLEKAVPQRHGHDMSSSFRDRFQ